MIEQGEWILILLLLLISFTGGQLWSILRDSALLGFIRKGGKLQMETVELVGDMLKDLQEKFP